VAGALRFAEAPERWLLGYGGRQKNLNRRAIEESPLRLTIGLPLESEAQATRGLAQGGARLAQGGAPPPPSRYSSGFFPTSLLIRRPLRLS